MKAVLLFLSLTTALCGCSFYSPEFFKEQPAHFPSHYSLYSEKADQPCQWWQEFNSTELNQLMDQAIEDNFSIREAWARLTQAHYAAVKAGANLYPDLYASAQGAYLEQKLKDMGQRGRDEWSLGLTAGYEVDLWGRVRAEEETMVVLAQASEGDLQSAMLSVSGEIGENWIILISSKKQQQLFNKQLEMQKRLLQVIIQRFPLAKSTALDIYQQQQVVERIEEALIPVQSRQELSKHQLALLTGRASLENQFKDENVFPEIDAIPALGLPADLIAQRPDIRAAGLRLKSAEWEIAAAKADRLPALRLTAAYNSLSEDINSLFDNWLLNLAANLTGPVFDGGRRKAEVERTKALADERLAAYGKTVFTAIKEVEDALTEEDQYARTLQSVQKQLKLSQQTVREARRRYLNSSTDFINVLREELNLILLEQNIIINEEKMIIARIRLHKALGGSWMTQEVSDGRQQGQGGK